MHNLLRIIAVLSFVFAIHSSAGAGKVCTQSEAIQAETEASTLKDWGEVYKSFKKFSHCDDGAIGEGYSSSVGRLLAEDWKHFDKFARLVSMDKGFDKFVFKHIDETVPSDVLKKIKSNVELRCPARGAQLCKKILAAIQ